MDMTRRDLLALAPSALALTAAPALNAAPVRMAKSQFALHPFLQGNPKAVFIQRTKVPHKMDEPSKLAAGLQLAREVLLPVERGGVPTSHRIVLKPNFTSVRSKDRPDEENWGTGTDAQFYEGMIIGLKELGLRKFHWVEANGFNTWNYRGLVDINERHGVEMNEPDRRARNFRDAYEMNWHQVPEAVVYKRIPHFAPVGEPDTWLLNIAKWKSHGMCMTLATKNLQGLVVKPFVRFCPGWSGVTGVPPWMKPDIHQNVEKVVNTFFDDHKRKGFARYDSAAPLSPVHQEIWAHKTCDHYQTVKPGLSIIEGLYGRDGDGFGVGNDHLTNLVMFGQDRLRLDMVGMYLGGHEPGNVNLFRIAKERGLTDTINPWEVEVYEWVNGAPVRRKLSDFTRTPLKTYYLQKAGEPKYHLVNEFFDYDKVKA